MSHLNHGKNWRILEPDPALVEALVKHQAIPLPIALALVNRGLTAPDAIEAYLEPRLSRMGDPFLLPDMGAAVARIWKAINGGEKILIHGDYDVDGITSTTLMVKVLQALGADPVPFIPRRLEDGYGLTLDSLAQCMTDYQPSLIITVDCGTGAADAASECRRLGVDVVITDHHDTAHAVEGVAALVNPKLGDNESLHLLAGVGVAFKLCHALVIHGRTVGNGAAKALDLRNFLYLAAMGTVADVVPLVEENRVLACCGLQSMNANRSVGIEQLMKVAGIQGDLKGYHIGFQLGPRLNAAGRLADPSVALDLLLATDTGQAAAFAEQLNRMNRDRQKVETQIVEEVFAEIDARFNPGKDFALVVSGEGWHPGVVGIVAARVVSRYHRPAVVIGVSAEGIGKGSCRSIDGFDLVRHLEKSSALLTRFGGHAMAAGLEIKAACIPAFSEQFNQAAGETLSHNDLRPVQKIDGWVDLSAINAGLITWIGKMEPFGMRNTRPVWACRGAEVCKGPCVVGKKHLKMEIIQGTVRLEAIGFNMAEREVPAEALDIAYQVQLNSFRGEERVQLQIQDFRKTP